MRKRVLRIAFVGKESPATARLLSGLSPAIHPQVYRGWSELDPTSAFAPELVVALPGVEPPPQWSSPVPVLFLTPEDWARPPLELEAHLLGDSGRRGAPTPETRLLGRSAAMARARGALVATARNSLPLLLTGENGTGKDLAATVAHELSPRAGQPFIAVNCGAVPTGLAETEFFGCVRGAFTGAENRTGFCQQALGGTLFLDEIGELAPEIQSKLLRVLENREVRRVGSGRLETVDFRLICATNRDLAGEVKAGRFREDLYYRVNVLPIKLPALRERFEDLRELTDHFLATEAELNRPVRVSQRALDSMTGYHWPGNLRQLRNVILRAAVLHNTQELQPQHLEWGD